METIKGQRVEFGKLREGDLFSIAELIDDSNPYQNFINIVTRPSMVATEIGKPFPVPFNSFAITNGRPRTFNENEIVYKYHRNLFNKNQ